MYINHDGTNSYIENETGNLYILNRSDDKDIVFQSDDGSGGLATYLQLDGSSTRTRAFKDVNFDDSIKATFGASSDLQIYHDGSNSYIDETGTGNLVIRANSQLVVQKYTGETMFKGIADGAFEAYHNNSKKLETTSTGVDVTGNISVSGTVDGRDVATDGTKLDGIEASADVTDATNVAAAGALMDSELTNLAAVKAINQSLVTTADVTFGSVSISNGKIEFNSNTDVDTGTETIATATGADAAFFDYVVKNGTNVRAGTITAVTDGTNVEFNEVSTVDLGDTRGVKLSVVLSSSNLLLKATVTSDNWNIQSFVRQIEL